MSETCYEMTKTSLDSKNVRSRGLFGVWEAVQPLMQNKDACIEFTGTSKFCETKQNTDREHVGDTESSAVRR